MSGEWVVVLALLLAAEYGVDQGVADLDSSHTRRDRAAPVGRGVPFLGLSARSSRSPEEADRVDPSSGADHEHAAADPLEAPLEVVPFQRVRPLAVGPSDQGHGSYSVAGVPRSVRDQDHSWREAQRAATGSASAAGPSRKEQDQEMSEDYRTAWSLPDLKLHETHYY